MATVLGPDMLTIIEEPVIVAPSEPYSKGSGFEGHEFLKHLQSEEEGILITLYIPQLFIVNCAMLPVRSYKRF